AYRFLGPDDETWISGRVLELTPEGSLILSWMEEDRGWVHPGRLVITLAPTPAGTHVTLAHDGFAGIGKPGWPGTVQGYERGADRHKILQRLADLATSGVEA
ncbi:MAG TPA: SRPBCC domain-containing protein, partial [Caulobacteraceae bacterium]|nr:SRPBCC domain-containing protein [Caulobacteraceae bacterium]